MVLANASRIKARAAAATKGKRKPAAVLRKEQECTDLKMKKQLISHQLRNKELEAQLEKFKAEAQQKDPETEIEKAEKEAKVAKREADKAVRKARSLAQAAKKDVLSSPVVDLLNASDSDPEESDDTEDEDYKKNQKWTKAMQKEGSTCKKKTKKRAPTKAAAKAPAKAQKKKTNKENKTNIFDNDDFTLNNMDSSSEEDDDTDLFGKTFGLGQMTQDSKPDPIVSSGYSTMKSIVPDFTGSNYAPPSTPKVASASHAVQVGILSSSALSQIDVVVNNIFSTVLERNVDGYKKGVADVIESEISKALQAKLNVMLEIKLNNIFDEKFGKGSILSNHLIAVNKLEAALKRYSPATKQVYLQNTYAKKTHFTNHSTSLPIPAAGYQTSLNPSSSLPPPASANPPRAAATLKPPPAPTVNVPPAQAAKPPTASAAPTFNMPTNREQTRFADPTNMKPPANQASTTASEQPIYNPVAATPPNQHITGSQKKIAPNEELIFDVVDAVNQGAIADPKQLMEAMNCVPANEQVANDLFGSIKSKAIWSGHLLMNYLGYPSKYSTEEDKAKMTPNIKFTFVSGPAYSI